jgi:hypothetical protein
LPRINQEFSGTNAADGGEMDDRGDREPIAMLDMLLVRAALSAFSTLFGSLGVFFTCLSFVNHGLGTEAVVCVTVAMAILWSKTKVA